MVSGNGSYLGLRYLGKKYAFRKMEFLQVGGEFLFSSQAQFYGRVRNLLSEI